MGSQRLSAVAHAAIADEENDVYVSAVSAMEITTKYRLGKLPEAEMLAEGFEQEVSEEGFLPVPIAIEHAALAGSIDIPHKDPFDRLLIAQSRIGRFRLVSNEKLFDGFGVDRFW